MFPSEWPVTQPAPRQSLGGLSRVRCIAFDAVGTLIYPDPPVPTAYCHVARKYGSQLSEQKIGERFVNAFRADDFDGNHITGERRERLRWQAIVGNVLDDVDDPTSCFAELFEHFAQPESWACFNDVAGTLSALDRHGYRLAVASNFDRRLEHILQGLPQLQSIAFTVISSVVGFRKPSRKFYQTLIDAAGCRSNEILMIGDDEANDVQAAQDAGLLALHLDRHRAERMPGRLASLEELPGMLGLSADGNLR